jgi:hypothetical protein
MNMRDLSAAEAAIVSGGSETITVTGQRPNNPNSVYPDDWQLRGMTPQEFIFGEDSGINVPLADFTIGIVDTDGRGPDQGEEREYIGPDIEVDTNNDDRDDLRI